MATEGTAIPAVRRRAKPRWLEGFLVQGGALIVAFLLSLLIGAIIIMLLVGCILTLIGILEATARRTIKK